jgi:hypothetical protein
MILMKDDAAQEKTKLVRLSHRDPTHWNPCTIASHLIASHRIAPNSTASHRFT